MNPSRLLSVLVENRPGVLNRVASMIRRRGFNIDSLSVGPTEDETVSRMTIAVHVGRQQAEQATKQLSKLIDVITIDDITEARKVSHELLLIRMHAPPDQRSEILDVVAVFLGRIVDIASSSMIIEITGTTEKVDNFVDLMRPYGIKEVARSGAVALVRGDQAGISLGDLDLTGEAPGGLRVGAGTAGAGITADTTGDI
ncbi:MAG: acetolactate synthase small subunit [Candidatus Dormibacteria bacterium]|jgi:acetolactate synthase-1/3 small subunit